jgi:catechol 2,3-dioxygenase-like lactoylglutathione lyase family enzyme
MIARLNHTIVPASDKRASAAFLARILGVEPARPYGPFMALVLGNDVTLDFLDAGVVHEHHYAFLVDDDDFEPIFGRIRSAGVRYYADPFRSQPNQINHNDGGCGVYFDDPDGHNMEVITRPYGSGQGN